MASKYVKGCSTSLSLGGCKSKLKWGTTWLPVGWLKSKGQNMIKCYRGRGRGKLEILVTDGRNVKWCGRYGKQCGSPSNTLKQIHYVVQKSRLWVHTQKNWKQDLEEIVLHSRGQAALFTKAKRLRGGMGGEEGKGSPIHSDRRRGFGWWAHDGVYRCRIIKLYT